MAMIFEDWNLTIGEIVAPFGRVGEVKVRLETDFPDRFARLPRVCLREQTGAARLYDVEGARVHKGQVLLKLKGVASIDDANQLRDRLVQIPRSSAVDLPENEHYIFDLLGSDVLTVGGVRLGQLETVLRSDAHDIYSIRTDAGEELLLPAVRNVVRKVDIRSKTIVVEPTEGLLPGDSRADENDPEPAQRPANKVSG